VRKPLTLPLTHDRQHLPGFRPADIALRAYHLDLQRGGEHGHDWYDWLQAEQSLQPTTDVAGAVVSDELPPQEWQVLQSARPNVLIAGSHVAVGAVLDALQPSFRQPVITWRADEPLVVRPLPSSGTLILQGVGALPREDQHRLLTWLRDTRGTVQLVSTTRLPLFQFVKRGEFLETLYYHLNVVYLVLER
jgi:Sigma-54 interaction domain/Protein of unknown function (DUF2934)